MHEEDVRQQRARRKTHWAPTEAKEAPVFGSDVSGLGVGRNYLLVGGEFRELPGDEWLRRTDEIAADMSWYHQPQKVKLKRGKTTVYWKERKMKDREKLGTNDKKGRAETDVLRETIDLRPDHSRALQKILATSTVPRGEVDLALADIHGEAARLFEKIYGRAVFAINEHTDSKQYHIDLSHTGIQKLEKDGEEFRPRTPFVGRGVYVGLAAWDRHRSALAGAGEDVGAVMRWTLEEVEEKTKKAPDRFGEEPRDLRFQRAFDEFVEGKLRELSSPAVEQARGEYVSWLKENYAADTIGFTEEKRDRRERKRLEREVGRLQGVLALVGRFLAALARLPGADKILGLPAIAPLFQEVLAACGAELAKAKEAKEPEVGQPEVREPEIEMKGPDIAAASKRLKEQVKELERIQMGRGKKKKNPEMPGP